MGAKGVSSAVVIVIVIVIAAVVTGGYFLLKGEEGGGAEGGAVIYIDGNDDFTPANGVTSGSGTADHPYIIENLVISAENENGIWIGNTTAHFIIRNCLIENGGKHYTGIYLYNVINGRLENCIVRNNSDGGIALELSNNNSISGNVIEKNEPGGIFLQNSDNNSISGNVVKSNALGITFLSSFNNSISGNVIENNAPGIVFYLSDNNSISGNVIEKNELAGIYLTTYSLSNLISSNTIENQHGYGIYTLYDSDKNHIYHNNITNNENQACDASSNYWDNGYPSGGNYWSDYTGSDTNGDGIGDTPYEIFGENNQDRYPLMNPV